MDFESFFWSLTANNRQTQERCPGIMEEDIATEQLMMLLCYHIGHSARASPTSVIVRDEACLAGQAGNLSVICNNLPSVKSIENICLCQAGKKPINVKTV